MNLKAFLNSKKGAFGQASQPVSSSNMSSLTPSGRHASSSSSKPIMPAKKKARSDSVSKSASSKGVTQNHGQGRNGQQQPRPATNVIAAAAAVAVSHDLGHAAAADRRRSDAAFFPLAGSLNPDPLSSTSGSRIGGSSISYSAGAGGFDAMNHDDDDEMSSGLSSSDSEPELTLMQLSRRSSLSTANEASGRKTSGAAQLARKKGRAKEAAALRVKNDSRAKKDDVVGFLPPTNTAGKQMSKASTSAKRPAQQAANRSIVAKREKIVAALQKLAPKLEPPVGMESTRKKAKQMDMEGNDHHSDDDSLDIPIQQLRHQKSHVNHDNVVDKREAYSFFQRKFTAAIDIEFKSSEIHPLSVAGHMWAKHKQLFGPVCGDKCMCMLDMEEMTKDVVALKLREKNDWNNPLNLDASTMPVGFMTNFANKFGPLLHKKYAKDSSTLLLDRLTNMWKIHRKQRMFDQTKCGEDCGCMEAWEFAFNEGALPSETALTRKRKSQPTKSVASVSQSANRAQFTSAGQSNSLAFAKIPLKAQDTVSVPEQMKEYMIEFETSKPLGFYCEEKIDTTGSLCCQVASIAPKGQGHSDRRIRRGSVVVGAMVDGRRQPIESPTDLRAIYDKARDDKLCLRLLIVNKHVSEASIEEGDARTDKDWSTFGYFHGAMSENSWAGGTLETRLSRKLAEAAKHDDYAPFNETVETLPSFGETEPSALSIPNELVERSLPIVRVLRILRPSRSVLKGGGNYTIRPFEKVIKRTRFSEMEDVREFYFTRATTEFMEHSGTSVDRGLTTGMSSALGRRELFAVFQSQSIREVLDILERGAAEFVSREHLDWIRRTSIKPSLDQTKETFRETGDLRLKPQLRDLEMKDIALKILIHAEEAVRSARALKRWVCLECFVEELVDLDIELSSLHQPVEAFLMCPMGSALTGSRRLPLFLDFPRGRVVSGDEERVMRLHHNASFDDGEELEIRLLSKTFEENTVILGTATVCKSQLGVSAASDLDTTVSFKFIPKKGSCLADGAVVRVRSRRVTLDPTVEDKKRSLIVTKVREILDWIKRFNAELFTGKETTLGLSCNVQAAGESLLHAAVHLEDQLLVEELVQLGARSGTSCRNSPLALALDMIEGSKDDRRGLLGTIVETLRRNNLSKPSKNLAENNILSQPVWLPGSKPPSVCLANTLKDKTLLENPNFDRSHNAGQEVIVSGDDNALTAAIQFPLVSGSSRESEEDMSDVTFDGLRPAVREYSDDYPHAERPSSSVVLPNLDSKLILMNELLAHRCHFHETTGRGCRRRTLKSDGCKYIHVHRPWDQLFEDLWRKCEGHEQLPFEFRDMVEDNTSIVKMPDSVRRPWYTAIFSTATNRRGTWRDVIFAERDDGHRNMQGVFWYASEAAARIALEKTVFATYWAIDHNYLPRFGIIGAFQVLPQYESAKRKLSPGSSASLSDSSSNGRFFNGNRQARYPPVVRSFNLPDEHRDDEQRVRTLFVRMSGLPYNVHEAEITKFFSIKNVHVETVRIIYGGNGSSTGEADVSFLTETQTSLALTFHGSFMGGRPVAIAAKPDSQPLQGASKANRPPQRDEVRSGSQVSSNDGAAYIRMTSFARDADKQAVESFFCKRDISPRRVVMTSGADGKCALVSFLTEADADRALKLDRRYMGNYAVCIQSGTKQEFDAALAAAS